MKHRIFAAVFALAVVAAVPAFGMQSLLTPDGIRYSLEPNSENPYIEVARAEGDTRTRLMVPSTQDPTREMQAQLAYDSASDTLFVVWTREQNGVGEVRYATLSAAGYWSPARLVTAGSTLYRGIQLVVTRSADTTLMHVAYWSINGNLQTPEYALFAFERGAVVSAEVENLEVLANLGAVSTAEYELETGSPAYPPLALDRRGNSVDVAFGSVGATSMNLVTITPEKVPGDVRIWKPLGRSGTRTPRTRLMATATSPVHAYIDNGHLALYTIGEAFDFVVLRNNGTWSPVRTVRIDAANTAQELLRELESTVEDLLDDEGDEEEESTATH